MQCNQIRSSISTIQNTIETTKQQREKASVPKLYDMRLDQLRKQLEGQRDILAGHLTKAGKFFY